MDRDTPTPPPAAVPVDLALLREVAWSGALSDFDRDLVRSAAIELEHLRAALAAAERERDEAAKVIADLRFNQSHLDAMRERWNELVAERDAARAEVERREEAAFRAGCLAPVGALTASDEVIDRAWARYRQQRAAAGEAQG